VIYNAVANVKVYISIANAPVIILLYNCTLLQKLSTH